MCMVDWLAHSQDILDMRRSTFFTAQSGQGHLRIPLFQDPANDGLGFPSPVKLAQLAMLHVGFGYKES